MTGFQHLCSIGIFILSSICVALGQDGSRLDPDAFQEEAAQIYSTIFHKYNERVRPPGDFPHPVQVTVLATLYHIREVNILKQEMETLIDLEIMWRDKRLAWYPYQVNEISANVSAVWAPDVMYLNGAVPPRAMFARKVAIRHDGEISWNRRETVTTMCATRPGRANQTCEINLGFVSPTMVVFSNDTEFDLVSDFDNHLWNVNNAELVRYSDTDVNLVVHLDSKPLNTEGNCSLSMKYNTNHSNRTSPWTSLYFLVFVIFCKLNL